MSSDCPCNSRLGTHDLHMRKKKSDYLIFDVLVGEEFEADGEKRTNWTAAATVFRDASTGKISGKVKEGLALTGRFIIKARDTKREGNTQKPGQDFE